MKGISSGGGKVWLCFKYVLEVQSIRFPDRLDVAVKEKERSMITPSFFGLSTSKQAGVATS